MPRDCLNEQERARVQALLQREQANFDDGAEWTFQISGHAVFRALAGECVPAQYVAAIRRVLAAEVEHA